jgi:hypothetical protein
LYFWHLTHTHDSFQECISSLYAAYIVYALHPVTSLICTIPFCTVFGTDRPQTIARFYFVPRTNARFPTPSCWSIYRRGCLGWIFFSSIDNNTHYDSITIATTKKHQMSSPFSPPTKTEWVPGQETVYKTCTTHTHTHTRFGITSSSTTPLSWCGSW